MDEDYYSYSIDLDKIYNYNKPIQIKIKGYDSEIDEKNNSDLDNIDDSSNYIYNILLPENINYLYKTQYIKLKDYIYVDPLLIKDIPLGSSIAYVSKKKFSKKGGFLKSIKDNTILELINSYNKSRWYVYTDQYHIFYKIPNRNKLKSALLNLINNDFKDIEDIQNKSFR
jgi:hypothetical protein